MDASMLIFNGLHEHDFQNHFAVAIKRLEE